MNKKTGNNNEAIKIFMKLLDDNIKEPILKQELYHFNEEKKRQKEVEKERIRASNREEFLKAVESEPEAKVIGLLQ